MKESKGFAITSMVLGIVSLVFFCCSYVVVPAALTGLVFGILSLVQHRAGFGMAVAGVVMCSLGLVIAIISIIVVRAAFDSGDGSSLDQWRRFLEQYNRSSRYA